jgi:hypothetical protein
VNKGFGTLVDDLCDRWYKYMEEAKEYLADDLTDTLYDTPDEGVQLSGSGYYTLPVGNFTPFELAVLHHLDVIEGEITVNFPVKSSRYEDCFDYYDAELVLHCYADGKLTYELKGWA